MTRSTGRFRPAFTLVEMLVVIAIIGVLAAILIPTVYGAIVRGKIAAIAIELNQVASAVEQYKIKHGDYPPDFSDPAVVSRHVSKAFPRNLDSVPSGLDTAEALVFWLGGLSEDPQHPFTGPGGPLDPTGTRYNGDRNIGFFSFDITRLSIDPTNPDQSNDEEILFGAPGSKDAFPVYFPPGLNVPYVYFDSRGYGNSYPPDDTAIISDTNAPSAVYPQGPFLTAANVDRMGVARPYRSEVRRTVPAGLESTVSQYLWHNEKTFQVICAGLDEHFGQNFFLATGMYKFDRFDKRLPSGTGFDFTTRTDHDNLANFNEGVFEDKME
jgi:prepilin-type N-terminal cleavage/methylation domain-containing protein